MSALTREDFFKNPKVDEGLDEYADACLDVLESGLSETAFPDPIDFLRSRGIDLFPEGGIEVHHTVGSVEPLRPLCPDGSDGCRPKCKRVGGELRCVWVCRCP